MVLTAYLQRVVNGGGRIDWEYSAGRGRMDLCVELAGDRYPLELKLRMGLKTREKGLEQIAGYMDTLGRKTGWLIIFERDPAIPWDQKITWDQVQHGDKTIHVVGC